MIKLQLKYRPDIPEADLISHVMGPDLHGAYYYVQTVMHTPEHTVANLYPLAPDETRLVTDEYGQQKVTF